MIRYVAGITVRDEFSLKGKADSEDGGSDHNQIEEDRAAADTIRQINNEHEQNGVCGGEIISPAGGPRSADSACAEESQSATTIYTTEYRKSPVEIVHVESVRQEEKETSGSSNSGGGEQEESSSSVLQTVLHNYSNFLPTRTTDVCDLRVIPDANNGTNVVMQRQYLHHHHHQQDTEEVDEDEEVVVTIRQDHHHHHHHQEQDQQAEQQQEEEVMILTQNQNASGGGQFPLRIRSDSYTFPPIFPHLPKNFSAQDETGLYHQQNLSLPFTIQGNYNNNNNSSNNNNNNVQQNEKHGEIDEVITGLKREDSNEDNNEHRYEDLLELDDKVRNSNSSGRYDDGNNLVVRRNHIEVCSNASGRSSEGIEHSTPPLNTSDRMLDYGQESKGELLDLHLPARDQQIIPSSTFAHHFATALHSPSSTPSPMNQQGSGHDDGGGGGVAEMYTTSSSGEVLHRLQTSSSLAALNQSNSYHHNHHSVHDVIQHSGNFSR